MFRDYIGHSICFFLTTSFFFFVMTFLIIIVKNTKTDNEVISNVALQQANLPTWSQVPGSLGFQYTRDVTLYSI